MKCLIVGPPGVGKSTLLGELSQRGFSTMDGDNAPGLAGWVDKKSNRKVADWSEEISTAPEGCTWGWDTSTMEKLVANPSGSPSFFAGNTYHIERFYGLFDKVIALVLDDTTLINRLTSPRNNPNNYGSKPEHIKKTLAINQGFVKQEKGRGAVILDASQSVATLADQVIELCRES